MIVLILGFLTVWLMLGKDQFANKFLQGASYLITTAIGYWAGNRDKKRQQTLKQMSGIDDAQIIE